MSVNLSTIQIPNSEEGAPEETGFSVELSFRRRPLFYLYNLIVPVVLMTVIGFFSLFLPNDSGEKLNLEVSGIK